MRFPNAQSTVTRRVTRLALLVSVCAAAFLTSSPVRGQDRTEPDFRGTLFRGVNLGVQPLRTAALDRDDIIAAGAGQALAMPDAGESPAIAAPPAALSNTVLSVPNASTGPITGTMIPARIPAPTSAPR